MVWPRETPLCIPGAFHADRSGGADGQPRSDPSRRTTYMQTLPSRAKKGESSRTGPLGRNAFGFPPRNYQQPHNEDSDREDVYTFLGEKNKSTSRQEHPPKASPGQ